MSGIGRAGESYLLLNAHIGRYLLSISVVLNEKGFSCVLTCEGLLYSANIVSGGQLWVHCIFLEIINVVLPATYLMYLFVSFHLFYKKRVQI